MPSNADRMLITQACSETAELNHGLTFEPKIMSVYLLRFNRASDTSAGAVITALTAAGNSVNTEMMYQTQAENSKAFYRFSKSCQESNGKLRADI